MTKKSIQQYISDLISDRLKTALTKEDENAKVAENIDNPLTKEDESKIVTTQEEMEAFLIVKTILRQKIAATRVVFRDAQSYFAILLDDNNRKTVCRLYLNGTKKYIGTFDEQKKEIKSELLTINDIFHYSKNLLSTVEQYDKSKEANP